jgi:hypothetical protein
MLFIYFITPFNFYYCIDTHLSLFLLSIFYAGSRLMKRQPQERREGTG